MRQDNYFGQDSVERTDAFNIADRAVVKYRWIVKEEQKRQI